MPQTIEATIDEPGNVRLLEPIQLSEPRITFFNYTIMKRPIPTITLRTKPGRRGILPRIGKT